MNVPRRFLVVFFAAAPLAACGQKGPLYLPGDPSEVQTEIPEIEREELPPAEDDGEDPEETEDDN